MPCRSLKQCTESAYPGHEAADLDGEECVAQDLGDAPGEEEGEEAELERDATREADDSQAALRRRLGHEQHDAPQAPDPGQHLDDCGRADELEAAFVKAQSYVT